MTFTLALLAIQSPPATVGGFPVSILIQIPLIFAIFYFLMIRPQQKQRQAHEERIRNIRKGDEVVTAGGIVGKVEPIRETIKDGTPVKTMEDRITIRSAESRLIVERGRIARIIGEPTVTEQKPTP
jgi:preprotein translocase subunit YajC